MGICDRDIGLCRCFSGFEGSACERMSANCGDHGVAMTISQLHDRYLIGSTEGAYSSWDAVKMTACVCDYGYIGPSCSMRMCPKGDDPMSTFTGYRSLSITTSASSGTLAGKFKLTFNGEYITFPADAASFSPEQCKYAFESMPTFESVSCERGTIDAMGGAAYTIRFKSYPSNPHENNIYTNDGNPALNLFSCVDYSVTGAVSPSCIVANIDADKVTPEYAICSNRGVCDFETGQCSCFTSFYGAACNSYTYAVREISSALAYDVMGIQTIDPDYKGNLLRLTSAVTGECDRTGICATPAFDFMKIRNKSDHEVLKMDGEGNIRVQGNFFIDKGGLTIEKKGLVVTGGLSVMKQGLIIGSGLGVTVNSGGIATDQSVTVVDDGLFITSEGVAVTGGLSMYTGDLQVYNGLRVAGGLSIDDSVFIGGGGLRVEDKGMNFPAGLTVTAGGLFVYNTLSLPKDGFTVSGYSDVSDGLVVTDGDATVYSGGVYVSASGVKVPDKLVVTGGLTLHDEGITIPAGATIVGGMSTTGGFSVEDIGVTVTSGGLKVTGGLTIEDDATNTDLIVLASLTINHGSFEVTGVTVESDGLVVSEAGVTVETSGLKVTGGLSMEWHRPYNLANFGKIGGYVLTGGVTLHDTGLYVTTGMTISGVGVKHDGTSPTIANNGLYITGGVTIDRGVVLPHGLTVVNSGIHVTQGGLILQDGLVLDHGLTIEGSAGGGHLMVTGGMTVNNAGVSIPVDGVSVLDSGLKITGGLTLTDTGMYVASDLMKVMKDGVRVVDVDTDNSEIGLILDGSLLITGGLTVQDSGLSIKQIGLTVQDKGMIITTGGVTVQDSKMVVMDWIIVGSVSVMEGGVSVTTGGVMMTDYPRAAADTSSARNALTITDKGLYITTKGLTVQHQGLHSKHQVSVNDVGVLIKETPDKVSIARTHKDGLTVTTGGLSVTLGGMEVGTSATTGGRTADGIVIDADGLEIMTNDLMITGSLSISDSGLEQKKGLTILSKGLTVKHDLCIDTVGLGVDTGGLTIMLDGLDMQSTTVGATVSSGVKVVGGLRVDGSTAKIVQDGVSIMADGLKVTGSVTIGNAGLLLYAQTAGWGGSSMTVTAGNLEVLDGDVTVDGNLVLTTGDFDIETGTSFVVNHGLTCPNGQIVPTLLSITDGGVDVDGGLGVSGNAKITGGLTIWSDSLSIVAGGLSIKADDLYITGTDGHVTITQGDVDVGSELSVRDGLTINSAGLFVTGGLTIHEDDGVVVTNGGVTVTTMGLTISKGSLDVTGGLTVFAAGIKVADGLTVETQGISVALGGLSVLTGGLYSSNTVSINTGGLKVIDGGVELPSGDFLVSGTGFDLTANAYVGAEMKVNGQLSIPSGGVFIKGSASATDDTAVEVSSDLVVPHNMKIKRDVDITGTTNVAERVSVLSGGLKTAADVELVGAGDDLVLTSGSLVVGASLKVTGGLSIHSQGLNVPSAGLITPNSLTVFDRGLQVTGGLCVENTGMTITTGGLRVKAGGLEVDGGMTISGSVTTNILRMQSDVSLATGGITTGGLVEVKGSGLKVTDGLTIHTGGLTVPTALTVSTGDLILDDPESTLLISTQGLTIDSKGLTIMKDGLSVTGGVTVVQHGVRMGANEPPATLWLKEAMDVKATHGLTINGGGMQVDGRLTVRDSGLLIKAGALNVGNSLKTVGGGTRPGLELKAGGFTHTSVVGSIPSAAAATIAGGVQVTPGGIDIVKQGFATASTAALLMVDGTLGVTGGLSVKTGGVLNPTELVISDDGLSITGGLTLTGALALTGDLTVGTNMDIATTVSIDGGLTVGNGLKIVDGLVIPADGLQISGGIIAEDVGMTVKSSGLIVTGGMTLADTESLIVKAAVCVETAGLRLVKGFNNPNLYIANQLTITDDGLNTYNGITITRDGLDVTGTVDLKQGGSEIELGIADGLQISGGGLHVTGGLTVQDSLTVANGVVITDGNLRLPTGNFVLTGDVTVNGAAFVKNGIDLTSGHLDVTGDVRIKNSGTVGTSSGVVIGAGLTSRGHVTISSSLSGTSLLLENPLTISSNGLKIANGLTIHNMGISVPAAMVIQNTGLDVPNSGMTIKGGLTVTGGLTLSSGNFIVPGDLVANGEVTVSSLAVANRAVLPSLKVKDWQGMGSMANLVVPANGAIANHLTSYHHLDVMGNLIITGELSIQSGGMRLAEAMTVTSGGLHVKAGGLTVKEGGLTLSDGPVVCGDGLHVADGDVQLSAGVNLAINGGGLKVNPVNGCPTTRACVEFVTGTDDFVVTQGDVVVSSGGVVVSSGDLADAGSSAYGENLIVDTVTGPDITLTGGLTVSNTGMKCPKLSVPDDGLFSPKLTVLSGGVQSQKYAMAPTMTINSGGMQVTGGMTVNTVGVNVVGSLTIATGVTFAYRPVISNGIEVTAGNVNVGATDTRHALHFAQSEHASVDVGSKGIQAPWLQVDGPIKTRSSCYIYPKAGSPIRGITVAEKAEFLDAVDFEADLFVSGGMTVNGGLVVKQDGWGDNIADDDTWLGSDDSPNDPEFQVFGDSTFESEPSGTKKTYSDQRLKSQIKVLTEPLQSLRNIRGVTFSWNETSIAEHAHASAPAAERGRRVGFIAQEVRSTIPEAVSEQASGAHLLGVDYEKLVPVVLEALKAVYARVLERGTTVFATAADTSRREGLHQELRELMHDQEILAAESEKLLARIAAVSVMVPTA